MRRFRQHRLCAVAAALATLPLAVGVNVALAQFSSSASATPSVTTLTLGNPASASSATTDGCVNITISWDAASNADSYRVQVKQGTGAWTDKFVETANVTQIIDSTGYAATSVTYRVFSRDASSDWEGPTPAVSTALTC